MVGGILVDLNFVENMLSCSKVLRSKEKFTIDTIVNYSKVYKFSLGSF